MRGSWVLGLAILFADAQAAAAYGDSSDERERISSTALIGIHLAATRAEVATTRPGPTEFVTTGVGPMLHVEGSFWGLFQPGRGSFYVRDWSSLELGLGKLHSDDEIANENFWLRYGLDLGLRAVLEVSSDVELSARLSYWGSGDTARDRGSSLQTGGGRSGPLATGGLRLGRLYGTGALGFGKDSAGSGYKMAAITGQYRYGDPGMLDSIGIWIEYVRGDRDVNDNFSGTNETHVRLTWSSF